MQLCRLSLGSFTPMHSKGKCKGPSKKLLHIDAERITAPWIHSTPKEKKERKRPRTSQADGREICLWATEILISCTSAIQGERGTLNIQIPVFPAMFKACHGPASGSVPRDSCIERLRYLGILCISFSVIKHFCKSTKGLSNPLIACMTSHLIPYILSK